jgi:hypothetical protein
LRDVINPLPDAAAILSLEYVPGPLEKAGGSITGGAALTWTAAVVGRVDGSPVRVSVSGARRSAVLIYGAAFPSLGLGLDIRRRSLPSVLSWRPGVRRIGFDSPLIARARHPASPKLPFDETATAAINELARLLPNLVVTDRTIDGSKRHSVFALPSPDEVASIVRQCARAAASLTG